VIGPSAYATGLAEEVLDNKLFLTISNGIDCSYWQPGEPTDRSKLGRVIYVGRLAREKDISVLIDAYARLSRSGEAFELTIVGDGPARRELQGQIQKLGLAGSTRITGSVSRSELRRLLTRADVFCMPSPVELQCCAVLEAMACGVPVTAVAAGALPETIGQGNGGALFAVGDSKACADAIGRVLQELRCDSEMRQRVRNMAVLHDMDRVAADLVKCYEKLAA
jgi:glycosyltransferase involved in cell wall biosynthesis